MNRPFLELVFCAVDRGCLESRKNETVRMGDKGARATLSQGPRPPGEQRLAGSLDAPWGPLQSPQPPAGAFPASSSPAQALRLGATTGLVNTEGERELLGAERPRGRFKACEVTKCERHCL